MTREFDLYPICMLHRCRYITNDIIKIYIHNILNRLSILIVKDSIYELFTEAIISTNHCLTLKLSSQTKQFWRTY